VVSVQAVDDFVASLQRGAMELPDVVFAVVGCSAEKARAAIADLQEISISHDNCPHQAILCGHPESIRVARERLRAQRVLTEELPFRSGFHSPLFAAHLPQFLEPLRRVPFRTPRTRLWSGTTCAPYPSDPEAIRDLVAAHFVKPVRFREVIERLYDEGVRIFVQAGLGSLINFVTDTLYGRAHLGIPALVPRRSGLSQIRRVAAALFVEGAPVRLDRVFAKPEHRASSTPYRLSLGAPLVRFDSSLALTAEALTATATRTADPLLDELHATLREATEAGREVLEAFRRGDGRAKSATRPTAATAGPRQASTQLRLSVEAMPALADHCFYRQAPGWEDISDRFPVVPMTTVIQLMIDAARKLVPEQTVVGVESVRAFRWLAVAPPVEVTVQARFEGNGRVKVSVDGYASATVMVAAGYPAPPAPRTTALANALSAPITTSELCTQRWMFHGPAYQGIVELGPIADNGIRGSIVNPHAPGALLDNAGQLMGYWVMVNTERDRLAFPVSIERIRFVLARNRLPAAELIVACGSSRSATPIRVPISSCAATDGSGRALRTGMTSASKPTM
jgi:acyl transferase domain-containing protein